MWRLVLPAQTFYSQPKQGQQVGQVDQSFGFLFLVSIEWMTTILLIQQLLQPPLYAVWQSEASQIIGDFNLKMELRHKNAFAEVVYRLEAGDFKGLF